MTKLILDGFAGFPPETLRFLRQLKRNNNREWFLAHKEVYERKVKDPMFALVLALGGALQSLAPGIVWDPKRAVYRIYRDVRFSPDKTPYKTHISAIFTPRGVPKHSGAALYFHLAPEEVLIAGGVYMPASAELLAIRQFIASHQAELIKILEEREFKRTFGKLGGEQLKRPPKGFPADHPAIDLLRHKQFLVSVQEPAEFAESPKFFRRLVSLFKSMTPLIDYLNTPLIRMARLAALGAPTGDIDPMLAEIEAQRS